MLLPLLMNNLLGVPAPPPVATTPIAISDTVHQFGHSKSKRPEEYVRMAHSQPIGTDPIMRYDQDLSEPGHHPGEVPPILVNPVTLEQEIPPLLSAFPPASAANPLGEASRAYSEDVNQQVIWFSSRHSIVNRWRTIIGAPFNIDLEWMAETGPAGLGLSMGVSSLRTEDVGTAAESEHEPQAAGARILPVDDTPLPTDEVNALPSVSIHADVTDEKLEGAVLPVELVDGPGSAERRYSPHNTDTTHVALYWRNRHYERVVPHVSGSAFVHEIVKFLYEPRSWEQTDFDAPTPQLTTTEASRFRYKASSKRSVMDGLGFDQGWYADLGRDRALKNLEDVFSGVTFDITTQQNWVCTKTATSYTGPAGAQTGPSLFPSGGGVLVHARSSDGFAVAIGGILDFLPNLKKVTTFELENGESAVRVTGVSVPHHSHGSGKTLFCRTEVTDRREVGWLGYRYYIYTGPLSLVLAQMKAVPMSTCPDGGKIMPSIVRRGTELADDADAIAVPVKLLRPSRARTFNARLR